jgi:hypothetical protein
MILNNPTDRPASYIQANDSVAPNIVRLVEDSTVQKNIRFDEISLPDIPGPLTGPENQMLNEIGLTYPIIRINDIILDKKNIMGMYISMNGFIPTIRLNLLFDNTAFISKNMPKDGDMISLYMRTSTDALSYLRDDFIITSSSGSKGSNGNPTTKLTISGKLFIPEFESKQMTTAITGSVKYVLKETAQIHGMGFAFNDFDDTNDYQTWIRCRESAEVFINNMVAHAWKDETSFYKAWVDLYYNLCFVNVNKFLLSTENEEKIDITFATNVLNMYNQLPVDTTVQAARSSLKILTNSSDFISTPFHIRKWYPVNTSTSISMLNGYSTSTFTYLHNQNIINSGDYDCFEVLDNVPAYDQNKTDSYILLRGRSKYDREFNPESEQARVNYDFVNTYVNKVWTGVEYVMDDDDKEKDPNNWAGNVHKNYNRAPYHNNQNINELNKLYIKVEVDGLNLQIMKGERVPVYIVFDNSVDNDMYNAISENDDKRSANRFYTGYYIVDSVEYEYKPMISKDSISQYTTIFTLKRREWPTPEAI